MDSNDKNLVASVLERGKRRRDEDDMLTPKDELDEPVADGLAVAANLGVEVAVDDTSGGSWVRDTGVFATWNVRHPDAT